MKTPVKKCCGVVPQIRSDPPPAYPGSIRYECPVCFRTTIASYSTLLDPSAQDLAAKQWNDSLRKASWESFKVWISYSSPTPWNVDYLRSVMGFLMVSGGMFTQILATNRDVRIAGLIFGCTGLILVNLPKWEKS